MENEAWDKAFKWVEEAVHGKSTSAYCLGLLVAMIFNQKLYGKSSQCVKSK